MHTRVGSHRLQTVVLLRWVLIIATAYLVVFSRAPHELPPAAGLFVAGYLASNLLLPLLAARLGSPQAFDTTLVLFDVLAVSLGLVLTRNAGGDFFPVYFLVIFVGALTSRLRVAVGAAVLISIIHLATLSEFMSTRELLDQGYVIRIPFLFAVALFFSFVVSRVRGRRRVARVAARERRRAEVLSAITHDIKSPLANVQSMAEILLSGDLGEIPEPQANLVRRMHASVRHVIQLSVNMLDAARIDAGRLGILPRIANLATTADDAVSLIRSAAMVKGVTLHYEREPDLPLAMFDPLQMERVLTNLIDNAVKYTPAGGLVTVRLRSVQGDIVIEVLDNGPGIAPDEIPMLFGKFRRRRQSSAIEGSGLGLFIVKAIVDAHAGQVEMRSKPGSGTTVLVRLPRIERAVLEPAHPNVILHPTALRTAVLSR
jgi:signal transduction histidine kinase